MTKSTRSVLAALLAASAESHYGFDLTSKTGVGPGTLYPMLARLEALGWIESRWEDVDPSEAGRPARRYYQLTGLGITEAKAATTTVRSTTNTNDGLAQA